jgi:hypothetical protein
MTILIDLSVAGINTGPFNLYSDADGYVTAFALNVTRQQLLDGYPAVVTNGTLNIKLQSLSDICPNDTILPVNATTSTTTSTSTSTTTSTSTSTTTSTTTAAPIQEYCVNWTAANIGGGKMSTQGYIDFTTGLAGRTINTTLSVGTITAYRIFGETTDRSCNIEMDFTSTRATWDTSLLDAPAGTALYSLIYSVEVICTNNDDLPPINNGQSYGTILPGGTTSEYNNCTP